MKRDEKVKTIPFCGMICALTFVFTAINFIIPFGAGKGTLVHLGAVALVASSYALPNIYGALSVGAGMALYDLFCGWTPWAPFTFAIRCAEAYVLSKFIVSGKKSRMTAGFALALIIDVAGYYIAEAIIYSSFVLPLASVPAEILHNAIGVVLGLPIVGIMKKSNFKIL